MSSVPASTPTGSAARSGALVDLRVLDVSTLFAGPSAAMLLGDLGADVIKVEHPAHPDASRSHGHAKAGVGLWWKTLGRNKRTCAIDLKTDDGADLLVRLASTADILIENFRPGTLDGWGITMARLQEANPGLVVVRISGFGQAGPRRRDPGFGTLAEAMSGFAIMTGEPDGPPTLPPLALADGVAGLAAAYAAMAALWVRQRTGKGQEVDLALYEPLMSLLGPQATVFDQLGIVHERTGNRSHNNAPRNTYRTRDGRWVAVSTSAQSIAERVMQLVGAPELIDEPWFASGHGRAEHVDVIDPIVAGWIRERTADEVVRAFSEAEAAATLIYDVRDVLSDPQVLARESIITLDDDDLGAMKMQNAIFRLSDTPPEIRHAGRHLGQDTREVLAEVGVDGETHERLRRDGVVA